MAAMKTTCPRCGYAKARANARGPDCVYCKKCGGLVPADYKQDEEAYSNDPVRSAIEHERGIRNVGVIRSKTPNRGGL